MAIKQQNSDAKQLVPSAFTSKIKFYCSRALCTIAKLLKMALVFKNIALDDFEESKVMTGI